MLAAMSSCGPAFPAKLADRSDQAREPPSRAFFLRTGLAWIFHKPSALTHIQARRKPRLHCTEAFNGRWFFFGSFSTECGRDLPVFLDTILSPRLPRPKLWQSQQ